MEKVQLLGSGRFRVHRGPRRHPPTVPSGDIPVAPPPRSNPPPASGWPLLLPLLGGAGSLPLVVASSGSGRRWLLLGMAASLLLSGVVGLGTRLLGRRAYNRARRAEATRYLAHLHDVGLRAAQVARSQRAAAEHLHPDLERLAGMIGGGRVWERSPPDADFLEVRVGRGPVALATPPRLDLGRDPLADYDPELLRAARDLVDRAGRLDDLPVALSLRRAGVVTIGGSAARGRSLARSVVLRSAVAHAPEDLRILAAFTPDAAPAWDWLKWLPHARTGPDGAGGEVEVPRCLLAVGAAGATELLEREVSPRRRAPVAPGGGGAGGASAIASRGSLPHLLVVVDGYSPAGAWRRRPVVAELLRAAPELGATVLWLAGRSADEPATTRCTVELDGDGGLAVRHAGPEGRGLAGVRADGASLALSEALARRLAPLWLDRAGEGAGSDRERPPPGLLDALGVPGPGAVGLDLASVWRRRPAAERLRVPIGLAIPHGTGEVPAGGGAGVVLDLKEAAHGGMGPHGLLIGATGSGKSELLRTIVAGLALTHPPELLSFALLDFKGGAAFAPLADLPHTAGLITNLQDDPSMVDRARTALLGEVERRQRLLREANLDSIAQHRSLAAAGRVEPLASLLVVVDEFGELLAAHPDFIDLFTTIGRTGRSLGIHLLLASQRLEESRLRGLDGHLRYRICLRTFSPAESTAVLGTPQAFHLPPSPGHGLLRVDDGPCLHFKGLRAASLLPGHPTGPRATPREPALVLPFDPIAGSPGDAPPPASHAPADAAEKLAAVAMEARAATDSRAHRIWLPPLPSVITLGDALRPPGPRVGKDRLGSHAATGSLPRACLPGDPGWLRVPVGIVDKPFIQSQRSLVLDFTGRRGHLAIAGAPRSGKSTLLATLVAGFALTHGPDDVQFYCIDLGGGLLHQLGELPHVGATIGVHEPGEARRLIRELRTVVAEREREFRTNGITSMAEWHARRHRDPTSSQDGYGEVFLVVDNWARLREELPDLDPEIESLAGVGLHHGLHLVIAADRWADIRLGLRDNLGGRLELRLNDPIESEVSRAAAAGLPPRTPGRGLTASGHQFQVALLAFADVAADPDTRRSADPIAADVAAEEVLRRAVRSPTGAVAPPLRRLPTVVPIDHLLQHAPAAELAASGGVPFALHDHRLEVVTLDLWSAPHFLVVGDAGCGKTATLRCLAQGLLTRHSSDDLRLIVVDYRRTLAGLAEVPHCEAAVDTPALAFDTIRRLRSLLDARLLQPPDAPRGRGHGARGLGGPRYCLVVDDYDLVASVAGNPLEPLIDLLPRGRDVGLHVLLARPVGGAARSSFEPFYQRIREGGGPGLIMSGDPREGELLAGRAAAPQPPGRGYLVRRHGRPGLVQVAWTPEGASRDRHGNEPAETHRRA
jgi:S-DNA-T family DNA segregation ATPase FtsK/SpoIIIE